MYFKLILVVFPICFSLFINNVSTLNIEEIVGGHLAFQPNYKYQAAIVGKKQQNSRVFELMGSGAIVHDFFIVSVAQHFLDNRGFLKYTMFFIRAGLTDLNTNEGLEIEVSKIYVGDYHSELALNDIAVLKLKTSLQIDINENLSRVRLPLPTESFINDLGRISGFGYISISSKLDPISKTYVRDGGYTNFKLRYAYVRVLSDEACKYNYDEVSTFQQHCGLVESDRPEQEWGFCTGDSGAPLVINKTLVGLASRNPYDCNDTIKGGIYTKIQFFKNLIDLIMAGVVVEGITVFDNWSFILNEERLDTAY